MFDQFLHTGSNQHALVMRVAVLEYKTYSGEPHGFLRRETVLDVYTRIERFLDWYLL